MTDNVNEQAFQLMIDYEPKIKALAYENQEGWNGRLSLGRIAYQDKPHNVELVWRIKETTTLHEYQLKEFWVHIYIEKRENRRFWKDKIHTESFLLENLPDGHKIKEYYFGVVKNILSELTGKFEEEKRVEEIKVEQQKNQRAVEEEQESLRVLKLADELEKQLEGKS